MDLSKISIFALMKEKMSWHSERQSRLAENIANADTPGYKPKDLKSLDFDDIMKSHHKHPMAMTNPRHMSSQSHIQKGSFALKEREDITEKPNGNAVNIEKEMLLMSENSADYSTTTSMYKKMVDLMKLTTGGGSQ